MTRNATATALLRFGVFELDAKSGELRRAGKRLKLPPQPFEVLVLLASRAGEAVSREEICRHLWAGDTFVDFDTALNSCIRKIRRALGDSAQTPRFLETLPRRGYRFVAPVEEVHPSGTAAAPRVEASPLRLFWPSAVACMVLVVASLVFIRARPAPAPAEPAGPKRLAVLPFENLGRGEAYFSDGLTEEIITSLGRLDTPDLRVIARGSVMQLKGSDKTPGEIGRDLDAHYLVEGSVRWGNDAVRITARLVQVDDQSQLWSEAYDYDPSDAFAVQSEVSSRLTAALAARLAAPFGAAPGPLRRTAPEVSEAFLKGRYHLHQWTPEGAESAMDFFAEAIGLDPAFAPAHASLAQASNLLRFTGHSPPADAHERARAAAERALELDPDLAAAHLALETVQLYYDWDLEAAGQSLRRALQLAPGMAEAHSQHAAWLAAAGRHGEAIEAARLAQQLDPLTQSVTADLCWYYNYAGRFDKAVDECSRALEMEPGHGWSQWGLEEAYRQLGRTAEALAAAPLIFGPPATQGQTQVQEPTEALRSLVRRRLERLLEMQDSHRIDPFAIGVLYALLGEQDPTLRNLERAIDEKSWWVVYLQADPRLDALRADPRFEDLVRRVGLAG